MDAAADRPEFAPPPQDGMWRGFALALLAHALLAVGLSGAVKWQRESADAVVEAELWSALPQQAAPREVVPPPPPPPPPQPVVVAPPPPPVVKAPPVPEPPAQRDADIALEREKEKRELQKRKQAELERERAEQRRLEAKKKREEELARQKQEQAKQLAEAKRTEEEKKRKEQEARELREAKVREKQREENLRRSLAMAGTGAPTSTGAAAQSTGPSATWGGKVQELVMPRITFVKETSSQWVTDVEVRMSSDGTILSRRVVKRSASPEWDEAVIAALDKVGKLPRDTDGRAPASAIIGFRPKK